MTLTMRPLTSAAALISAAVAVTPDRMLSSEPVAVTVVEPRIRVSILNFDFAKGLRCQ